MKELTEKQLHNLLDKYYKKYYGELDTDEWYVNPAEERDSSLIYLKSDTRAGMSMIFWI